MVYRWPCLLCFLAASVAAAALGSHAAAQTAQVGADAAARSTGKLRMEYVHYRPAVWEREKVREFETEHVNEGGLLYLYYTNTSEEPVQLRFWRVNGKDESYWRLNHFIAWDRAYAEQLAPGATGVLEINATAADFAPGRPFSFAWVDGSWKPVLSHRQESLIEDPVQISCIRVLPGMRELEVHVRNTGADTAEILGLEAVGRACGPADWVGNPLAGPGQAIARLPLESPLRASELVVVRLRLRMGDGERAVFAHRRAFEDQFPIGVWSGGDATYAAQRRMHIDTLVQGGTKDNRFFSEFAPQLGLRAMVHTGLPVRVDTVREFSGHPAVICWMLQDEPDWSIPPNIMLFADQTVRLYDSTKPTFITLCRNIKFFEYAPIPDIPCMDHYSVTAPSSSKWPKVYGTRLEETGYYTRDLRRASEPKPIWIWSQAIADWGQRPKRPVPTPDELAAQLVLNLGEGAKGILWFNYSEKLAEKWPDAIEAMRGWGRVMRVLREDFLASEPGIYDKVTPDQVEVAPLITRDKMILCVTNLDYEIHPEAYPWVEKRDVALALSLPRWIAPAAAAIVAPEGITPLSLAAADGTARLTLPRLGACAIVVLSNDAAAPANLAAAHADAVAQEQ